MTSAIWYFLWFCPLLMNVLDVKTAMLQDVLRPLVSIVDIHLRKQNQLFNFQWMPRAQVYGSMVECFSIVHYGQCWVSGQVNKGGAVTKAPLFYITFNFSIGVLKWFKRYSYMFR